MPCAKITIIDTEIPPEDIDTGVPPEEKPPELIGSEMYLLLAGAALITILIFKK